MNIDEMPAGREMDALIAEAMGWFKYDDTGGLFEYWCRKRTKKDYPHQTEDWLERYPVVSTGYSVEPIDNIEDLGILSGLIHRGVWNPSANPTPAREVIDRLDELYAAWFEIKGPKGWLVQCNCLGRQYTAVASTLSLAICRVALKVIKDSSGQNAKPGPNLAAAILSSLPSVLKHSVRPEGKSEGGNVFFKGKPECKRPVGYNPPPGDIKRPEKPTPAPPAKLYDKLGRRVG